MQAGVAELAPPRGPADGQGPPSAEWSSGVQRLAGSGGGGYTVVQSKFRGRPREPADNLGWLLNEIDKELDRWTNPKYERARTAERPDYLLVTTNVVLSAAQNGGHDTATRELDARAHQRGLPLKGWKVWHYDQICTLLDTQPEVRTAYGGFITVAMFWAICRSQLRRAKVLHCQPSGRERPSGCSA